MNKYLFESLLSILLGVYPEVELLGHIVILRLILYATAMLPPAAAFYILTLYIYIYIYIYICVCVCIYIYTYIYMPSDGCEKVAHCGRSICSSVLICIREGNGTPVLLPGKSHGQRSLVGCSPWGCEESDTTERLHFHFSLYCIGEGNCNPLQCSCLENPRDGGAWWAAIYEITQSWTRLKRLSSSSSS